ncbi:hypothetical protein A2U01_0065930, partial [Trifolium medium]|nr:hypothetical protein [Trifolium medium]
MDAKLSREVHSSIPATAIRKGLEPLDARTDLHSRLCGPVGWIPV